MPVKNKVQLVTYPDSMGGDLRSLEAALDELFPALFAGGIHILPPFPSSGDRGFAPLTYAEIEPTFGDWDDVKRLGKTYDILLDVMVNHISRQSPYFRDYEANGAESEWADLFIPLAKVWPDGITKQDDVDVMVLRRAQPYSTFEVGHDKAPTELWTTFGKETPSEQVDMDWRSPIFTTLLEETFRTFADNGVKIVRLDAVGYLVKKAGTDCFFVEPEIFQFLDWIKAMATGLGVEILPEIHSRKAIQFRLAERGFWIYDFILPYLIMDGLFTSSTGALKDYIAERPARQFTMLDCHDGVPVKPDVEGFYTPEGVRALTERCARNGGDFSLVASDAHKDPDGFDVHQICGTYYSLLGNDDDAYIVARALQFFVPGIPQVYYVGLLAGQNDEEAVRRTGEGRELNRHNYSMDELRVAAATDVVRRLVDLIRFRNTHPAFEGDFELLASDPDTVAMKWSNGGEACWLNADLRWKTATITTISAQGIEESFRA